jgi:hypothetical protein
METLISAVRPVLLTRITDTEPADHRFWAAAAVMAQAMWAGNMAAAPLPGPMVPAAWLSLNTEGKIGMIISITPTLAALAVPVS